MIWKALVMAVLLGSAVEARPPVDRSRVGRPIVIAHRGASAARPEHTLAAYAEAIRAGADFIEPDLVATKDHVLVARHENEISGTTDVAARAEFAARKATKTIDGVTTTGWFTEDFTLAELKTLYARERLPQLRPANTAYDHERIPTFVEIIALANGAGRTVGIYPETKHPSYFAALGLSLEPPLLAALEAAGWTHATSPVFIQSFEIANLKALHRQTGVRLIQLIGEGLSGDGVAYDSLVTPEGLRGVAAYAYGIGPNKDRIIGRDIAGRLQAPTTLVADAHAAGLMLHPWTFRPENFFLPTDFRVGVDPRARGDIAGEYRAFLATGIDGLFADDPESAVAAVRQPR